ncbi:MAG: protein BatD [Bacteroidales bacterium]|nr:protein BatD [Bacteroidales bacterium]
MRIGSEMKYLLANILFILTVIPGYSDDIKFSVSAPKVVAVGEQFRLIYSLNSKANKFSAPEFDDFYVIAGPSTSYNQSTQIINGKVTRNVSYTYTYILQSTREGKFTIPPAIVVVNKKQYSANSLQIEVIKGKNQSQTKASATQSQINQGLANIGNEDLFVRVLVNKSNVYQGAYLVATVKIYSRVNLSGFEKVDLPDFNGFYMQEIEIPQLTSLERENINGQIYGTGVIKKYLLFPQYSGNIVIEPVEIECLVQQTVPRASQSFFDDFFSFNSVRNTKKIILSPEVNINVKPLPAGAPSSFSGTVGSVNMIAGPDKSSVKENDAVTFKITLKGTGNLKLAEAPIVDFPPDFETYDPKVSTNLKAGISGTTGSKTFEYLVIPRHAGNYRIAPVKYSFFDPVSRKYKSLSSEEFLIEVSKGEKGEDGNIISGFTKEEVRYLGKDIRFIITGPIKVKEKGKIIFGTSLFLLVHTGLFLLFFLVYILVRYSTKRNANVILLRNRRANKQAKKRLKIAGREMRANNAKGFFEEVLKALWGYMSDKLSIPVSELSQENIRQSINEKTVDKKFVDEFIELVDTCEYAQYAPAGESFLLEDIYQKAINVISKLEQGLGRNNP